MQYSREAFFETGLQRVKVRTGRVGRLQVNRGAAGVLREGQRELRERHCVAGQVRPGEQPGEGIRDGRGIAVDHRLVAERRTAELLRRYGIEVVVDRQVHRVISRVADLEDHALPDLPLDVYIPTNGIRILRIRIENRDALSQKCAGPEGCAGRLYDP